MSDTIYEAWGELKDACECLSNAHRKLEDADEECQREWKQLSRLVGYVKQSRLALEGHMRDSCHEIEKYVKMWEEENDRLADLADGQSY